MWLVVGLCVLVVEFVCVGLVCCVGMVVVVGVVGGVLWLLLRVVLVGVPLRVVACGCVIA